MSTGNKPKKRVETKNRAFEMLDHYLFWEWQYCYRNDLLRKMILQENIKVPGEERLVSADKFLKNIVPHWSPRVIRKHIEDGLFEAERILVDAFENRLEYRCPSSRQTVYHSLIFEVLDDENIEELSRNKGGLIPFDLSIDIDVASLELKLFYYTHVVDDPRHYEDKICDVIIELTEKKIKSFSGYRSFNKTKQDPPRAVGIFLWDYVFNHQFKRGSMSTSFEEFSRFIGKNKINKSSIPLSDESLESHYKQTHEQILTREVRPMSPPKTTKKPASPP